MSREPRTYLSSTHEDLASVRVATALALRAAGMNPVDLHLQGADARRPVDFCLQEVRRCDAVIGVLGERYGHVPSREFGGDGERSMTWLELDQARRARIPTFVFVPAQPPSEPRQRAFYDWVRDGFTTDEYEDPAEIPGLVVIAMHRRPRRLPMMGAALIGAVVGCLVSLPMAFIGVEWRPLARYTDAFLASVHTTTISLPSPTTALVLYEEASTQELGPFGPETRQHHGTLVRRLVDQGARAIAFDVVFEGTTEHDAAFAEAIEYAAANGVEVIVGVAPWPCAPTSHTERHASSSPDHDGTTESLRTAGVVEASICVTAGAEGMPLAQTGWSLRGRPGSQSVLPGLALATRLAWMRHRCDERDLPFEAIFVGPRLAPPGFDLREGACGATEPSEVCVDAIAHQKEACHYATFDAQHLLSPAEAGSQSIRAAYSAIPLRYAVGTRTDLVAARYLDVLGDHPNPATESRFRDMAVLIGSEDEGDVHRVRWGIGPVDIPGHLAHLDAIEALIHRPTEALRRAPTSAHVVSSSFAGVLGALIVWFVTPTMRVLMAVLATAMLALVPAAGVVLLGLLFAPGGDALATILSGLSLLIWSRFLAPWRTR